MRKALCIFLLAGSAISAPAVAAVKIGYVSITGGNIANFLDLAVQFPGHTFSYFGGVGFKGTYRTPEACNIGFPVDACFGGIGSFPTSAFGSSNLDTIFATGSQFGASGIGEADFWTSYNNSTTGDTVVTTFHRITPGSWTSPLAPGVPEPATWAMMIAGFAMAGAAMRKRKAAYLMSNGKRAVA